MEGIQRYQACKLDSLELRFIIILLIFPPDPLYAFGQRVKSIYIKQPDIPQDDWPPVRKTHYINLALLNTGAIKDGDEFSRFTIRGCMDDILTDKEEIGFSDVFMNVESGCRILFEGRPGSGKTTLMQKVSLEWTKGQILGQITVFILIQLRVFVSKDDMTLHDIVGLYQPPSIDSLCETIEQKNGEGLCIGIDGLDEYSPAIYKKSYIHRLIKRKVLPNAIVIVASRPAASQKFRRAVDTNVEVLGFLKPQIDQYITDYYSKNCSKARGLIAYLEQHPNVKHACYLPLHLAMVAYLFDVMGSSLPERETEIYRHFTLSTICRTLFRERELADSVSGTMRISSINDLQPEKYQTFMSICQLAFQATAQQKQIFSDSEVNDSFRVDPHGEYLGLITTDEQYALYGLDETYSFLHLTLQEFLAAYHLTELNEDELIKCVKQYIRKPHMFEVFKFYFGITQVRSSAAVGIFKDILETNRCNQLLLVQYAYESQNAETSQMLASLSDGVISIEKKTLNPSDFTALGYVMKSASRAFHETNIISCSVTSEGVLALIKAVGDCYFPGEKIKYVNN